MSDAKIYVDLSKEIQQLLADNEMSITDILQRENVDFNQVTFETMPEQSEEGARTRGLVPLILASSAAVSAIGFAISKVVNSLKPTGDDTIDTFVVRFSFKHGIFMKFRSEQKGRERQMNDE